eukprot:UN05541
MENCKDQIVFMTHVGPFSSRTTIVEKDTTIMSGSKTIDNIIEKHKSKIVCNIHGHVHDSPGCSFISTCPIINPGSLP